MGVGVLMLETPMASASGYWASTLPRSGEGWGGGGSPSWMRGGTYPRPLPLVLGSPCSAREHGCKRAIGTERPDGQGVAFVPAGRQATAHERTHRPSPQKPGPITRRGMRPPGAIRDAGYGFGRRFRRARSPLRERVSPEVCQEKWEPVFRFDRPTTKSRLRKPPGCPAPAPASKPSDPASTARLSSSASCPAS